MKIIVAHPAQQHSYRTAAALKQEGMLYKYITTVYNKPFSLTSLCTKFLKGKLRKKAESRVCAQLDNEDILQFVELEGLIKLFAMHVTWAKPFYYKINYHTADRFAKKVANYAIKHKVDAVITYDDSSPLLFEIIKKRAPSIKCILDVSIANHLYMRKIFERDELLAPKFSQRLHDEMPFVWNTQNNIRAIREINSADYFLVPSLFVKKSLMYSGVKEEQLMICPYGVDADMFQSKKYEDIELVKKRPIRYIFVGGVKERKGAYYLLEAFKQIPKEKAELTIVGTVNTSDEDLQPYLQYVNFTGMVLHSDVPALLQKSDVYIFPSLAEGLTLSALEAAACGLPLILTENTGANDCISDGVEGFIIPAQSVEAIVDKVMWFSEHPEAIEKMGKASRHMAEQYTWARYGKNLVKVLTEKIN